MKIVFTGGGTLGHIFPSIAVIREMRDIYPGSDLKLSYIGPKHNYGELLFKEQNVEVRRILSGKIRRYFSFKNLLDVFKVPIGFIQSLFWLFIIAPDIVFSKGGYGSFPVAVACFFLRVPLVLQESDIVPGLASKITSKWASEIFTSFSNTEYFPKDKVICVGNPVRKELLEGTIEKAKELFKLKGEKPVILILGGSQGSARINNLMIEILPELLKSFEIIHQTGRHKHLTIERESKALLSKESMSIYHLLPFLNEEQLKQALAVSDLVISRAGSGALFEIASSKKPAILIPLSNSAQDHQKKNAYAFAEAGGGEVVEEQNLKPNFFLQKLQSLFSNKESLKIISQNSSNFSKPLAAKKIANYLIEYLSLN